MKQGLRQILLFLHLDLTKNLAYDRMTTEILQKILRQDSNCIDVGAHKGEVLTKMLEFAPEGQHFAIEPIPHLYEALQKGYGHKVQVISQAISDRQGITTFQHVRNAEAYSGLKPRSYDIARPDVNEMKIATTTLDAVVPEGTRIELIKIDVEGGEYDVMLGAKKILNRDRPILIFECGQGGIDHYGYDPDDIWSLLTDFNYALFTLGHWLKEKSSLTFLEFQGHYQRGTEYYFLACPIKIY